MFYPCDVQIRQRLSSLTFPQKSKRTAKCGRHLKLQVKWKEREEESILTYLPIASIRVIKYAPRRCDQLGRSRKNATTTQRSFTTTHNSSHHLQSSAAQHQPSESKASSLDRQQKGATQQTFTYIRCVWGRPCSNGVTCTDGERLCDYPLSLFKMFFSWGQVTVLRSRGIVFW